MKIHRYTLAAIVVWTIFLAYFLVRDRDAMILSLVLTPVLGIFAWAAIRSGHVVLSMFMSLALISHALAPPFFFMRREFYTYGGDFGAVKDFSFGVGEFLKIYLYVLGYLAFTLVFAIAIYWCWSSGPRVLARQRRQPRVRPPGGLRRDELVLAIFVITVAVPVNLFMYSQRIGITGMVGPILPYRLTGLLTYFRMLAIPLILIGLFSRTRRGPTAAALIGIYGFIAGFAASSRFILLIAMAPVALFAFFERRFLQMASICLAGALTFVLVSASRDYVYAGDLSFFELVGTTVGNYDLSQISPFEMVGGVANRLWGPQDVVLAYQYHVGNRLEAIGKYFDQQIVVENLTHEFYGMTFSEADGSAGFGVGLGYIPWMILLADRSIPVLMLVAFITACILNASEWVVSLYRRRDDWWSTATYPVSFILVYCIYTSSLNWWTDVILLVLGLIVLVRLVERSGWRVMFQTPGVE
jgi:hypothetical protein